MISLEPLYVTCACTDADGVTVKDALAYLSQTEYSKETETPVEKVTFPEKAPLLKDHVLE